MDDSKQEQPDQKKANQLANTKQSAADVTSQLEPAVKILEGQRLHEHLATELEEAQQLSFCLQILKFIVITVPGILLILAVGAIIFYFCDWVFSMFDFDLSEYTYWVVTFLCLANVTMSICGCCGAFRFNKMEENYGGKLQLAVKELQELNNLLKEDNQQLHRSLIKIEMETLQLENENVETETFARKIAQLHPKLMNSRRNHAQEWVEYRKLHNLWKIYESYMIILQIKKISKAYYKYAVGKNGGLNKAGYDDLVEIVVPKRDRHLFPKFNDKVWWQKSHQDDEIFFDQFEKVVERIYTWILNKSKENWLPQSL